MSLPQTQISLRSQAPLFAAMLAAAVTMFAPPVLNDGDTWWHLAAGQWILAHQQVPHVDPFSYTMRGHPWQAHEWLSEVLMAGAFRLAGWSGIAMLYGLAVGVAAWLVTQRLSRILGGITLLVVVALACACVGPSLLLRPHLLVLPLLAGWMLELLAARDANRPPRLWVALLIIPWANLHGSFVFGYALLGAFGLEALIAGWADRWDVIRRWAPFALLAMAGAVVTPHGVNGLIFPFQLMTMTGLQSIAEWTAADFATLQPFEIALIATLFVCLHRGVRIPLVRLIILLALLHMALQHSRHLMILAVVAPLLLAEPLALALGQQRDDTSRPRAIWVGAAIMVLVLGGARLAFPLVREDRTNSPITAFSHIPRDLLSQPVLNEYSLGGYLIYRGVRPYIDGRADMYGDQYLAAYLHATKPTPPALAALVASNHITWTFLSPRNSAVPWFDAQPEWRRLYSDRFAIIHVRRSTPPTVQGTTSRTSAPPSTTR